MESAFAEKFCRRLNDGRPDSSIATISPSMIVPSGSFANAAAMWGKRLSNRFAIELGQPNSFVLLVPAYVRGEAYLAMGDGQRAAAEFQKFIDYRGSVGNLPWGALARLGLARAYAMQGDTAKARAAYQDFLTLWRDADPDVPLLKQAKAEYAKLQ